MNSVESHGTTRPTRRTICLATGLMLAAFSGCTKPPQIHQLGEKVQLGGMVFSVLDAEWAADIDAGGANAKTPQHRFLIVHLTMSNTGSKEATIPLLHVVAADKSEQLELAEGQGVPNWLGILRTLNPAESKEGRIVFDVPPGAYSLRLTDGGDQERELTAMVVLPPNAGKGSMDSPLLNQTK